MDNTEIADKLKQLGKKYDCNNVLELFYFYTIKHKDEWDSIKLDLHNDVIYSNRVTNYYNKLFKNIEDRLK